LAQPKAELRIRRIDLRSILRQAKKEYPQEACGIMIGTREGTTFVCDHLIPEENADRSPISFTIAPEELLKAYRHADQVKMEFIGVYHSHPAPPAPSRTDLGFMKWSAPVWLIVSNADWTYSAHRLDEGKPVRVDVTPC
jgi:proteasome lid subunit RPN8/RPN11